MIIQLVCLFLIIGCSRTVNYLLSVALNSIWMIVSEIWNDVGLYGEVIYWQICAIICVLNVNFQSSACCNLLDNVWPGAASFQSDQQQFAPLDFSEMCSQFIHVHLLNDGALTLCYKCILVWKVHSHEKESLVYILEVYNCVAYLLYQNFWICKYYIIYIPVQRDCVEIDGKKLQSQEIFYDVIW